MRILVACEESQRVCIAFRNRGHEAYSCDVIDCSGGHPEWHIKDDVLKHLNDGWDMMIAHPPCTYLSYVGIGWFNEERYGQKAVERKTKREAAMNFFTSLYNAPIERVAVENPTGYPNSVFRKPDQIIQPYYFGDNHKKATCLWLKNLPKLIWSDEETLFESVTALPEPEPLTIQLRKPSKYYKGGEIKKRYFTDAATRDPRERSKTFPGIANAMAEQWSENLLSSSLRRGGD